MFATYLNDFINITVSVPRGSFDRPEDGDDLQQVPNLPGFDQGYNTNEGHIPSPNRMDALETESFYDDFFGCVKKTPEDAKRVEQNYRLSSTGELKRLKERSNFNAKQKRNPWRLIIEEEDILTSSPVLAKPQTAMNNLKKTEQDHQAYLNFLRRVGWKSGILPG